jgi:hypothetical protein
MTFRFQTTRYIDGQLPVFRSPATQRGLRTTSAFRQSHSLILHQFGHGKTVVGLDQIQVIQRHAGSLQ